MLDASKIKPFGLSAIAYELPGEAIDIIDYANSEGVGADRIDRLLANGVRYFYDGSDRSDADMIGAAIDKIIGEKGTKWLKDVTYVIHTRTQTFSMPAPPSSILSQVCAEYGIHPKLSFGIEQIACSGVVRAIDWAMRLLGSDKAAKYALVITSDRVFGGAEHRIRQDSGVQCDAGTAMLVARDDLICQFGPISYKTFPNLYEGPSTQALNSEIARMTPIQTKEAFAHHAEICDREISEFSRLLPINADRYYWEKIAEYLGIGCDVFFFDNITNCGHACCGDFALNLVDGGLSELKAGGTVVYCGQSNLGIYGNLTICPTVASRAKATMVKKSNLGKVNV